MPPVPLAWKNGRFVPAGDLTLSFADAGFVSAATVTDFCRTYRHRLFRWPDHLARLRRDCDAVRVFLPYTDAELTQAAERLVADASAGLPAGDDLALVTFATPGQLGHMLWDGGDEPRHSPTVGMHTFPLSKERYRRFFAEGVTLAVAGVHPRADSQIIPGGVKHRSRLHWWQADQAVRESHPGAVAVLTDQDGNAADTAVGTVLAVIDGAVVRPRRGEVLESVSVGVVEELCGRLGIAFREDSLAYREASELLLVGSGFGVAGVREWVDESDRTPFEWPGPVYRKLLTAWGEMVGLDVGRQFLN